MARRVDSVTCLRIERLGLEPHPEGGRYRRFHTSALHVAGGHGPRPAMTALQYLLGPREGNAWQRVDADECWHWAGGALELRQHVPGSGVVERVRLGPAGTRGHACWIVPAGAWQTSRALADAALVTCVVAPGFVRERFDLLDARSPLAGELTRLAVLQR